MTIDLHTFQGAAVQFDAKPSEAMRTALRCQGFRWNPQSRTWYARRWTAAGIEALEDLDRRERGEPRPPDGPCWRCKAPGYFRAYGAATPVYCDACEDHAKRLEAMDRAQRSANHAKEPRCVVWDCDLRRYAVTDERELETYFAGCNPLHVAEPEGGVA